jgi:hypothetical protein
MEDPKTGGLTWSRTSILIFPTLNVASKTEAGRTYLDFSALRAKITFSPALKLPSHFTLTAWVQTPGPTNAAAIWQGSGGDYLTIKETEIIYWSARTEKFGFWAQTTEPIRGWHHVALVGNGRKVQAFLDGKPLAATEDLDMADVSTVGNHRSADADHRNMAAGIDEQFLFTKSLSAPEVVTVMTSSQPPEVKR